MFKIDIANKIIDLRKKQGLSQTAMAKLLDVDRSTLFRYEKGERTPDMDFLVKMAKCFNISLDEYILDKKNENFIDTQHEKKRLHDENAGEIIYAKLVEIGFIKDGDEITEKHLKILAEVLAPQVDFALFKLKQEE